MARTSRRPRRTSHLYMPGAFDLFSPSKELVLKNIWVFGPLYALTLIFYIHSWIWSPLPHQHKHLWQNADGFSAGWPGAPWPEYLTFLVVGFSLLWLIIIVFGGTIAQIMAQKAQLEAAAQRHMDFRILWSAVKDFGWRMLGLYIVMLVIFSVGLAIFIIPGLILIRRYMFAPYVMLERNTSIGESLSRSAALSRRNPGSVWGLMGVMFLIGLLDILPWIGGLAAFIFGCLYSVAPAMRYQQLKKLA